jgi:anti-sigma28 factor (negative regulator of flagellin synthesis)
MANRKKQHPGSRPAPDNYKRNAKRKGAARRHSTKDAVLLGKENLLKQMRQIIAETPEIRQEKVGPLQEAVEQGTHCIDVRKLANILITKLFLDP